jgi:hypothetical protein
VSTDQYLNENSGFDCSADESYRIYLPCQWLVEKMNLRWNGVEGCFFNERGELIALDPSLREAGPTACLVKYDALLKFLSENGHDILWTFLGEKIILNGSPRHGRLKLSGAFRIQNDQVKGVVNSKLVLHDES